MRVVTCVGSISSGKTTLLNILQANLHDGKCFSVSEQKKIAQISEEFDPKYESKPENVVAEKAVSTSSGVTKQRNKLIKRHNRNKVIPGDEKVAATPNKSQQSSKPNVISKKWSESSEIKGSEEKCEIDKTHVEQKSILRYSDLLGKTAPTVGVNHFEFLVDDLTLQVAGEYKLRRKRNKTVASSNFWHNVGCCCATRVLNSRGDVVELRELGGQIGRYFS